MEETSADLLTRALKTYHVRYGAGDVQLDRLEEVLREQKTPQKKRRKNVKMD